MKDLLLKKYKYKNLLDVLLEVPKGYQNLLPITSLSSLPTQGVLQATILSHQKTSKTLRISAFLPDFNLPLEIIIFHPKHFHTLIFPLQSRLWLYGVLERKNTLEMIQPKVIKCIGCIAPLFEKRKSAAMQALRPLITQEHLKEEGIPQEFIPALLEIFHPTAQFFQAFMQEQKFPPMHLRALKFVEIFLYLRTLRAKKLSFPSKAICHGEIHSFIASLPFSLTQGQKEAIAQIKQDLSSPIASKRLIMGDVGCGKTIVILSAVILAYPYKSILMAPTTLLAIQLYQEAKKYLPSSLRVGLFLGDTKSRKQNFGDFDFVVGTQALLHRNEDLSDFALVMSDEQHRFGTQQRFILEKLASQQGKKPHILQFSATPIPRTMAMLHSDLIAHTFILDLPFKKEICTQILSKKDMPFLLSHIHQQIQEGHQTIIVYPLVRENEKSPYLSLQESRAYWEKRFEGVYCTNGGDREKDKVLEEFREKGSILLATTLIEVGISLPKLTTIVISGAERMGLATLHQLRGRVSRNGLRGYCFLFTHSQDHQRLKDFAQKTNGFEIAELDLKYRKSGDLLEGERQSGENFRFFKLHEDEDLAKKAKESLNYPKSPKSKI